MSGNLVPVDGWLTDWERFYKEVFFLDVDFSDVEIPHEKPGFDWVVVVAQGLTMNHVFFVCSAWFNLYLDESKDLYRCKMNLNHLYFDDRGTKVAYAKRFRDRVEADEENAKLSPVDLPKREVTYITLIERILLELWYHWKTGEHLDIENTTLCVGARTYSGRVPSVSWSRGRLYISSCQLDVATRKIRARTAI
jgi:hypothetical protein